MKRIKLTKNKYDLLITDSDDILFIVPPNEIVRSEINIKINMISKKKSIRLNFITSHTSTLDIKVLTLIPKESTNNDIEINLTGLITKPETSITFEPSFELYNNSTVVTHSSSVGIIDKKWENYLYSRGLSKEKIILLFNESFDNGSK